MTFHPSCRGWKSCRLPFQETLSYAEQGRRSSRTLQWSLLNISKISGKETLDFMARARYLTRRHKQTVYKIERMYGSTKTILGGCRFGHADVTMGIQARDTKGKKRRYQALKKGGKHLVLKHDWKGLSRLDKSTHCTEGETGVRHELVKRAHGNSPAKPEATIEASQIGPRTSFSLYPIQVKAEALSNLKKGRKNLVLKHDWKGLTRLDKSTLST